MSGHFARRPASGGAGLAGGPERALAAGAALFVPAPLACIVGGLDTVAGVIAAFAGLVAAFATVEVLLRPIGARRRAVMAILRQDQRVGYVAAFQLRIPGESGAKSGAAS